MYYYFKGVITELLKDSICLEVADIGYLIHVALPHSFKIGDKSTIYIYESRKENAVDLFGFKSDSDLDLFNSLLKVSGVGAKTALSLFSVEDSNALISAINNGNESYLTRFPGIGKKTASQIIFDLKNTLKSDVILPSIFDDAIDAISSLGFKQADALRAVSKIESFDDLQDLIKKALNNLVV
jgi:Holliday junction DNA helicase RuvA